MSASELQIQIDEIHARNILRVKDIFTLRQLMFADGVVDKEEAEGIFSLSQIDGSDSAIWNSFFLDAIIDYTVYQAAPRGYVTLENAQWLISHLDNEQGYVESATDLELVIKILESARWAPTLLADFALNQVKRSVLMGEGPISETHELSAGVIHRAHVSILRRILYAFGASGNVFLSRSEAELLCHLNRATAESQNDPAWSDLFIKAIANHVLGMSGYVAPSRQEALRRQAWLDQPIQGGAFFSSMLKGGLQAIWHSYRAQSDEERYLEQIEAQKLEIILGEQITAPEAAWLNEQLGQGGTLLENEKILLQFIKEHANKIDHSLAPLIARAA